MTPPAPTPGRPIRTSTRRGSAMIAVILVLVVLQFIVLGIVIAGARDNDSSTTRIAGVQTFYAAEGVANMSLRELYNSSDEDGDGGVGTISNDGNAANNPSINGVTGMVTSSVSGSTTTLTVTATGTNARRKLTITVNN